MSKEIKFLLPERLGDFLFDSPVVGKFLWDRERNPEKNMEYWPSWRVSGALAIAAGASFAAGSPELAVAAFTGAVITGYFWLVGMPWPGETKK